jgi:hypothetical protein
MVARRYNLRSRLEKGNRGFRRYSKAVVRVFAVYDYKVGAVLAHHSRKRAHEGANSGPTDEVSYR